VTYQGAFAMALRILDWDLCMMTMDYVGVAGAFHRISGIL